MSIKSLQVGQAGVSNNTPSWVYIETNDTYATVTASGYLSGAANEYVNTFKNNMMALVSTKASQSIGVAPVLYLLQLQNVNGVWSLLAPATDITPPLIVEGDIQAGSNGIAGGFVSYPSAANQGYLSLQADTNSAGNFHTEIATAGSVAQNQLVIIPDVGTSNGTLFLMASGNNAKINGTESANAVTVNGTAGVITTSSLTTAGASSYAITWTNSFIKSSSVVLLTIAGGTNTTENITLKVAPGAGSATLTIYNNTAATALNGTILISYLVM